MHDALTLVTHGEEGEAKLCSVVAQNLHLLCRDGVGDRQVNVGCWNVVIFGSNSEVGATQWAAGHAQTIEGLWAGDFMHEVQVDVQQVGFAFGAVHNVLVPHLLRQCHGVRHGVPFEFF